LNIKAFKFFYAIKAFFKYLPEFTAVFMWFILFVAICIFIYDSFREDFLIVIFGGLILSIFGLIFLPFIYAAILIVLEIILYIWSLFLDKNEYENIVNYYDLKYLKYMQDTQEEFVNNKKRVTNLNFLKGLLLGLGIGFLFFDE